MRNATTLPLVCTALLFAGCDIVDDPVEGPTSSGVCEGGVVIAEGYGPGATRKILLEDLTGHRCNNCPQAAEIARQLQEDHPEDVFPVGVHVISFAAPLAPPDDDFYDTDFRTPAGNDYASQFGVSFLPVGMVNREEYAGSVLVDRSAWSSAVNDMLGQPAEFDMWFSKLVYTGSSHTVCTEVKVVPLTPLTADHNLTIYLTEDSVVDWQLNSDATPPDVPDYVHRHVLRTNLNGSWGAPLGTAAVGDTLTFTYSGIALDPSWNPAHCALLGYVYNAANYEVMQVAEREFEP